MSLALGGVLILYAVVGLLSTRLHVAAPTERWLSPVIGFATGVVNGATGVSVAACLAWTGHFQIASAGASTLALLPVFLGMYAGELIRVRLHAEAYRKWFFIGLIGLGGYSVLRAVGNL